MNKPDKIEEIVKQIFYSPATNGRAEESIAQGIKLINKYSNQLLREVIEEVEEFKSGWSTEGNTKYIVDGMNMAIQILRNSIEFKNCKHTCVQTGLPCGFPCYDKCPVHKAIKILNNKLKK